MRFNITTSIPFYFRLLPLPIPQQQCILFDTNFMVTCIPGNITLAYSDRNSMMTISTGVNVSTAFANSLCSSCQTSFLSVEAAAEAARRRAKPLFQCEVFRGQAFAFIPQAFPPLSPLMFLSL